MRSSRTASEGSEERDSVVMLDSVDQWQPLRILKKDDLEVSKG
jgi:hypothetical protein